MTARNPSKWQGPARNSGIICFAAALLLLSAVCGTTAEPAKSNQDLLSQTASTEMIPLPEVATRAAEVVNTLTAMQTNLTTSSHLRNVQEALLQASEQIRQQLPRTAGILQGQPSLATLQAQEKLWQGVKAQTSEWLKIVTARSVELRKALDQLAELETIWSRTRDAALDSLASSSVLNEINESLQAIKAMQSSVDLQLRDALDLQTKIARQLTHAETALAQVAQAQSMAMTGMLKRDGLPIWSPVLWAKATDSLSMTFAEIVKNCLEDIENYFTDPSRGLPLHVAIFLTLSLLFSAVKRRMHQWQASADGSAVTITVFDRPYAAAFFGALFFATRATSTLPITVHQLFLILEFIPMIRLTQPLIDPRLRPWIYILWFMFCLDIVRQALASVPLIGQVVLGLEAIAGIVLISWSLFSGYLSLIQTEPSAPLRVRFIVRGAKLILAILCIGLAVGVLGYIRLASLLVPGIAVGATLALTIYLFYWILLDFVAYILRVWPLRLLNMVQLHRDLLERRARRLLLWLGIATWVARFLDYFGLLESVISFVQDLFTAKLERGSVTISLADALAFLLTVWVAYLLSALIRFLLKEDVYPRLGVAQGVSYAVSSLLNYVVLALGVVLGLGLMGVDLSKVTILVSAFGVGIGFGLQSVVNNFVCGLILLFERPVHVGDLVQIGDLLAVVRRIGIRASTVRTRQGADLIVPNSELVTGQVTNWTYGDHLRRIQLPVGVNYGADPKKVIALLQDVARKHPRVLDDPPARALFMSYGDNSINFELRAWTDEYLHWQDVRSDLAIAVYDAVNEAGMSFPFPQREVHLVHQTSAPSAEPESVQTSSVARNGGIAPRTTDDQSSGKSAEKSGGKADADL